MRGLGLARTALAEAERARARVLVARRRVARGGRSARLRSAAALSSRRPEAQGLRRGAASTRRRPLSRRRLAARSCLRLSERHTAPPRRHRARAVEKARAPPILPAAAAAASVDRATHAISSAQRLESRPAAVDALRVLARLGRRVEARALQSASARAGSPLEASTQVRGTSLRRVRRSRRRRRSWRSTARPTPATSHRRARAATRAGGCRRGRRAAPPSARNQRDEGERSRRRNPRRPVADALRGRTVSIGGVGAAFGARASKLRRQR